MKETYGDQFGEFVLRYWGLRGYQMTKPFEQAFIYNKWVTTFKMNCSLNE